MVHILLLILKIIGWILLAILGIIVLFICILLFTPVRYKVNLEKHGDFKEAKGSAKITWFFRLISFQADYEKEKLTYCFRLAWKKWKNDDEEKRQEDFEKSDIWDDLEELETPKKKPKEKPKEEPVRHTPEDKRKEPVKPKPGKGEGEHEEKSFEQPKKRKAKSEYILEDETVFDEPEKKGEKKSRVSEGTHQTSEKSEQGAKKTHIDKIKCTLKKICDKINLLRKKKDEVLAWIHEEVHAQAIKKAKKEVIRLVKIILPDKWKGRFDIGFEDPCTTGKLLAGFSVIYPFTGDHIELNPDFENSVFEGDIFIKGKLSLCHFVATGIRLLLNKNIRLTYNDVKKIREKGQEAE